MISIIIPIYNSSKYILETLKTCYNQTYKDFEILIIDDFSTDNSCDLIHNEIAKNSHIIIKYYLNKIKGISNARNFGVENSSGDYLYFLDSDDLLVENALEILKINSTNYDIVIGNWVNFVEVDAFPINSSFIKSKITDILNYWIIKPPICFLIKKNTNLWDNNLNTWEVNDYVLGNYLNGMNLCVITDVVLKVRQHTSVHRASIANDHFEKKKTLETFIYIYYKYNKFVYFDNKLRAILIQDIVSLSYRLRINISDDIESDFKYLRNLNDFKYFSLIGFAYLFGNRGIKWYYNINKLIGRV